MNQSDFIEELKKINIFPKEDQLTKLHKFYELLTNWNKKINLTRITEEKEVYLKHFYDSLTITKVIDLNKYNTLCDVGTGAGFPGIVLKIMYPNLKITLIDSLQKRVNYLNEIIKELDLKEIEAIHVRAEDYKGQIDVVTSRAVANIEKLVTNTMHLVSKNGVFIAMKGDIDKELTPDITNKLEKKYNIISIEKFSLPIENSKRCLITMKNK